MNVRIGLSAAVMLVGAALLTGAARADRLDGQLNKQMPEIVAGLKAKYKNVGILRFRTQEGARPESFDSPLCGRLAERLETLLILNNGPDESKALGVIHDAGTAAASYKIGSWYTSTAERKKLFRHSYAMAWGSRTARPDAFLTGKLIVSKDRKTTTLTLECIEKTDPSRINKLATISVATDRNVLRDLGHSLVLSRSSRDKLLALKRNTDKDDDDFLITPTSNQQPANGKPGNPPKNGDDTKAEPGDVGGVTVQVLIDGTPATIRQASTEGDAIAWQVESPKPGSNIAIGLRNKTDRKLGVVLRLNGANTVGEGKDEPETAPKWLIPPMKAFLIKGFYPMEGGQANERGKGKATKRDSQPNPGTDDQKPPTNGNQEGTKVKPFRVLVGEEAQKIAGQLGDKKGLIEVTVFEQGPQRQQNPSLTQPKGLPPSKEKQARSSYLGLRSALLKSNKLKSTVVVKGDGPTAIKREVIVPDEEAIKVDQTLRIEEFPNARMVAHVSIKVVPAEVPIDKE